MIRKNKLQAIRLASLIWVAGFVVLLIPFLLLAPNNKAEARLFVAPELNQLESSNQAVFGQNETPTFVVDTAGSITTNETKSASGKLDIGMSSITATASQSGYSDQLQPEISAGGGDKSDQYQIKLDKNQFRPGKYQLSVKLATPTSQQTLTQDFTWGVLAINLDKSTYQVGETATIGIGVLDDLGKTLCDAKVWLKIIDPSEQATELSTENKTIKISETCANGNVTNIPDYLASYIPKLEGNYRIELRAETANGPRNLTESFEVLANPDFVISRPDTSMRIVPTSIYTVNINVLANKDLSGGIKEKVPASFGISGISAGGEITNKNETTQTIAWPANLKAGESLKLSYQYDAPDISPQFYLLGSLEIWQPTIESEGNGEVKETTVFTEPRSWQIASDAAITYVGGQVGSSAGVNGNTTVTFSLTGGSNSTPQAGDLVVISYSNGDTTDKTLTITNASSVAYTYAGGADLYQNGSSFDSNFVVGYRFMPATPETSALIAGGDTSGGLAWTVHVFRNVDPNTPLDVAAVTAGNTGTHLANPGAITPTTSGAWIYVAGAGATNTGANYAAAYLTDFRTASGADTQDGDVGAGYVTWSSGQYDPAAFTGGGTDSSGDSWNAVTMALRPYVAPAPGSCSSTGSTDWNVGSTWTGTCTGAGGIPSAIDSATILTGHNVTIPTGVSAVATDVTVDNGGTLTVTSTGTLVMSGNLANAGTVTGTGAITVSGASSVISGSGSATNLTGTFTVSGTTGPSITATTTFGGAVTLSGGGTSAITISGTITSTGTLTISGTVTSTGTVTASGTFTGGGSWTQNNGSTLNLAGAAANANAVTTFSASTNSNTVNYNLTGAQTCKVTNYYNLIFSGSGAKTCALAGGTNSVQNVTLNDSATWTFSASSTITGILTINTGTAVTVGAFTVTVTGATSITGTLTITSATGTKNLSGAVTVNDGGNLIFNTAVETVAFGSDLTVSNGGTITFTVAEILTIAGNLQVDGAWTGTTGAITMSGTTKTFSGTTATTIASLASTSVTNNGNLTVTGVISGALFTNGATGVLTVGAAPSVTTFTANASGNSVTYNCASSCTMDAESTGHYYDLIISTGVITSIATTVDHNLTVSSGTFRLVGVALTVTGTTSVSGTIDTLTSASNTKAFNGKVTVNAGGTFNATGVDPVVTFGAGIQNDSANLFNAGGNNSNTLIGDISGSGVGGFIFEGNLTVPSGTTNNNYASGIVTVTGVLTFTGGWTQGASSTLSYGSTTILGNGGGGTFNASSNANTVIYNVAGGGQSVLGTTYSTLTLSNTGGTDTASTNIVTTTLNTTASGILDMATFTLGVTTTPVNNLGTIKTQCVTNPPITASKSWGGTVEYNSTTAAQYIPAGTFNNLIVSNNYSSGVTLVDSVTVNGTFTDITPNSKLIFTSTKTFSFAAINIHGDGTGNVIMTVTGVGQWNFIVPGTPTVTYVTVDHSDATGSGAQIDATSNCTDGAGGGTNTYWNFNSNANPNPPASLTQKNNADVAISESAWTNSNTPKLGFTISDPNGADTVKYEVQLATDSGFSSLILDYTHDSLSVNPTTFTFVVGSYGSGSCSGTCPTTLDDSSGGYWWRVKAIDNNTAASSYVEPGVAGTMDFKVDATAPTGGTVNDGTGADVSYNDGSLSTLSANWSGIDSTVSGLLKYEYAIGTTAGGNDTKTWTDNNTTATITDSTLSLRTGQTYFFSVRTTDNAGNVSTPITSNGQAVAPILTFSYLSGSAITFNELNSDNTIPYTDNSKTTVLRTSTNAYGGYVIKAYSTDKLRKSLAEYFDDFAHANSAPATWSGTGFGYTTSDDNLSGGTADRFTNGGPNYAGFTESAPGDPVADHTANVSGSPITNEDFTITYRVTGNATTTAGKYTTTIIYTCIPQY